MTSPLDQFSAQRRMADEALAGMLPSRYPYPAFLGLAQAVDDAQSRLGALSSHLRVLVDVWRERPRRGPAPPVRLVVGSSLDSRGDWRLSWNPIFDSYDDSRSFLTLQHTRFGSSKPIGLPRFQETAIFLQGHHKDPGSDAATLTAARQLLQAACSLFDVFLADMAETCETHPARRVGVTHAGLIEERDLDAEYHRDLCNWLDGFSQEGPIPLAELRGAVEAGIGTGALHRHFQEVRPGTWSMGQISRAQRQMQLALEYNTAWWRSGPIAPLPDARPLGKPVPENRALVQRAGRKPRLSPVAIRGIEGTAVVPAENLKETILQRIDQATGDWHFTAGDFSDLVAPDARMQAMRCLDRLKRSGHIRSVSKGVYRRHTCRPNPLEGILALTRDRGEHACPAPGGGFYTDGALRSFRYEAENYDLRPDPCPGWSRAALQAPDMSVFLALAENLLRPGHLDAQQARKLAQEHPEDLDLARQVTGRFA